RAEIGRGRRRPPPAALRGLETGGAGGRRRGAGRKCAASPATSEKIAAPSAKAALHCASTRPRYAAAVPSASRLRTIPTKKANESITPRRRLVASGAPSTCAPTYPTTPTPAGSVQGQVLVESKPPSVATSNATEGYCATEADTLSMKSNGFISSGARI